MGSGWSNGRQLYDASRDGNLLKVVALLSNPQGRSFINCQDENGLTPIHIATAKGRTDVVKELISAGCDKNLADKHGQTPIFTAAWKGLHPDVIKELIHGRCDINLATKSGQTPLQVAELNGYDSIANLIRNAGSFNLASVSPANAAGRRPPSANAAAARAVAGGAAATKGCDSDKTPRSATCSTPGCTRETWNGHTGEQCCRTCNNSHAKPHGPDCEQKIRWHNYCKSLSLSDLWESQGRSEQKLYAVNRNGPEFSFVENLFNETMRNHCNSTITCIQRVENGMQHDAYKVQSMNIAMDITKAPGTVPAGIEHDFVRWLFHGTGQENIEHIVNSQATGFLPMLAGSAVGAIWGNGTYFARDAKYSHDYTEAKIDVLTRQSQRKMLLNRVIVGEWDKGAPGITKFPMAKGEKYRQCNSLVDDVEDPSIFVIQHSNQAYSSYVITYTSV